MMERFPYLDESAVKLRAFELWQSRGCPLGSPEVDWYEAKQSLAAPLDAGPPRVTQGRSEPRGEYPSTPPQASPAVTRLRNGLLYVGNGKVRRRGHPG
jgi:hypothetical protein